MKRKSVHAELYDLRQAATKLWQYSRPEVMEKEDARRWEDLRLALGLPAEPGVSVRAAAAAAAARAGQA